MDNIKDDQYYVGKLMSDLEFIIKHTKSVSFKQFDSNELLQDSMMFRLIQISEIVLKLSEDFKESYSKVPWFAIKGLRNRIVHDYGNVDMTIVFATIKNDIPDIYRLFKEMQKGVKI
jgi:uncharacterized protein with HEPN domain